MRRGALREFVMSIFEDGVEHTKEDIEKKVDENFENQIYTKKQLRDLIYNLSKERKIDKISKGIYCISKMECFSLSGEESKPQSIEDDLIKLEDICFQLKKDLNAPELIMRVKRLSYNIQEIERLYDLNEQMLRAITNLKK